MNSEQFNKYLDWRIGEIRKVLSSKAQEYANDDNKLIAFENAGKRRGITRERALDGMLLKHEVSVGDMINDLDNNILPTPEKLHEKIGDIINYYILLEACFTDRIFQKKVEDESTNGNIS